MQEKLNQRADLTNRWAKGMDIALPYYPYPDIFSCEKCGQNMKKGWFPYCHECLSFNAIKIAGRRKPRS